MRYGHRTYEPGNTRRRDACDRRTLSARDPTECYETGRAFFSTCLVPGDGSFHYT
jgi:hypothetical protein